MVNQPVELKQEKIVIERVPVSGESAGSCGTEFTEEEIYIPLRREEAVIAKESRITEVRVGKREERETQTVSETVRKEEAAIGENVSDSRLPTGAARPKTQKYEAKERSRTS